MKGGNFIILISAYQFCACNRLEVLNFRGVSECFTATKVNYFITEEIPGEPEKKTEETHVCRDDVFLSGGRDKYHLINDMLICQDLHDELTGRELLEQYAGQEALVKHFFQIRKTEDTGKR